MKHHSYSETIAEAIIDYLDKEDYRYTFKADRGTIQLLLGVDGKVKTLIYQIILHDHGFTVSARYPLGPSPKDSQMTTMALFLTRANYKLRNGNFELDLDEGDINYKAYCNCRGIAAPSDEMVEESIHCPAAMFRRYEAGIQGILFHDMSDKEAIERCEGDHMSLLDKLEELKARLDALKRAGDEDIDIDEEEEADNDGENIDVDILPPFDNFLQMLAERTGSGRGEDSEEDFEDFTDSDTIDAD